MNTHHKGFHKNPTGGHPIISNNFGCFALHSYPDGKNHFSPAEQAKLFGSKGPIAAAEKAYQAELARPAVVESEEFGELAGR